MRSGLFAVLALLWALPALGQDSAYIPPAAPECRRVGDVPSLRIDPATAARMAEIGLDRAGVFARMQETFEMRHFLVGLSKAPVFAVLIALIGCLEGLQVQGTAQSVGERTTSSVVQSISLVIVIDALAAIWFMHMDW